MKTICNRGTEKQTHFLGLLKKKIALKQIKMNFTFVVLFLLNA